jgi:aryl-alcohol dehydrogenase-like predicted oxidoreductase
MSKFLSKLGLGTAQWGLSYGISNQSGQTIRDEVARILKFARDSDVRLIDTARSYGHAEQALGDNNLSGFKVITKLAGLSDQHASQLSLGEMLESSFVKSLDLMGVDNVQGLLVHNCDDLFSQFGAGIIQFLNRQKSLERCHKIGVSVYSSLQINKVLDLFTPDIIQLPFSVFDQRLLRDGTLAALKELGVEIHARSVFLQGLLLMKVEDIPVYFRHWMPQLSAWNQICSDLRLPPQHAALDYVISNHYINQVIVGVENLSQLVDLLSATYGNDVSRFDVLSQSDPEILNPALWNLKS